MVPLLALYLQVPQLYVTSVRCGKFASAGEQHPLIDFLWTWKLSRNELGQVFEERPPANTKKAG